MSWRTRRRIYEYVRNSLWIVPALLTAIAIAMGILLPNLDENVSRTIGISYGSGAAQGILGAMAGGMITFTGFVFSILLLAVQFGSSQFSPRMLRHFLRDPTTKFSLGIFMATFIYALLVLRTIGEDGSDFVPDNSISVSLLLLLLSMIMFLRLIHKTTQGLRVAAVVADVGRDARKVFDRLYPDDATGPDAALEPSPEGEQVAEVTFTDEPGILQSIHATGLVGLAIENDVVIELVPRVGDLLAPDVPLFRIHGDAQIDPEVLRRSVAVGDERTMEQDPAFAFRLLADISSKALSPGVNDPTTSVQALDQIELLLRRIAGKQLRPGILKDDSGVHRLRVAAPTWEDFLSIALDETRFFGETSVQVMRRMRALLVDLREVAPEFRRPPIDAQLALLDQTVSGGYSEATTQAIAGSLDRQGIGTPR